MTTSKKTDPIVKAAFGARNRARLIGEYFLAQEPLVPSTAWKHVYRLLLWTDKSNGLAHCYESDKCQPGKNWYERSLKFHDWVSSSLETSPSALAGKIDWLFRRATSDLAAEVLSKADALAAAGAKQRQPYEGRGFPKPGEDPELTSIMAETLKGHFVNYPSPEKWQALIERVRQYLKLENKRRNLVGEGFEDLLADIIRRTLGTSTVSVHTRCYLEKLPDFRAPKHGSKPNKIDLAIVDRRGTKRTIVTVKWSVRADREKQFVSDYDDYMDANASQRPFDHVFVTNEFDPARLKRACELQHGNHDVFTRVVHVSTDALKATYTGAREGSMKDVTHYIDERRLVSLGDWLDILAQ